MQFSTSSSKLDRLPYKWIVVMVVIFGSFMSILDQTVINNALFTTVIRFTFTSLGIAVLATLTQNRASTHISTLVHQFRPVSHAALALIGKLGLDLAVQDAFWLSLAAFILAFIAVCFIQVQKPVLQEQDAGSTTLKPAKGVLVKGYRRSLDGSHE